MPTGYTAGILDGDINSFKEFATLCMRAFGATLHMRDESMDTPFEPRVPSGYHKEQIRKANEKIQEASMLSDAELISKKRAELLESKEYALNGIKRANENWVKLISILKGVYGWEPPTPDHTGIKDFMIQQIRDTIKQDCRTSYYDESLVLTEMELSNLNAAVIRAEILAKAERDLQYNQEELDKEIKRCNDSNEWVRVLLESLNGNPATKKA